MNFLMFQDKKRDVAKRNQEVEKFFHFGLYLKGIDSVLEILGAFLLFIPSAAQLNHFIVVVTQNELSEDPSDAIGNYLRNLVHSLNGQTQWYGFLYLLSHGVVKLFLIIMLLKNKLWAYPLSIVVFFLFVFYQVYQYVLHPSLGLIVLTIFDVAIIILTWLEYKILKKHYQHVPT